MTAQTAPISMTYQTTISEISTVDQQGQPRQRPVLATAIIPQHSQRYGMRLSVEPEMVRGFRAGDLVTIVVQRGEARKEPPRYPSDWWWNLWSINKGHTAPVVTRVGSPAAPTNSGTTTAEPILPEDDRTWSNPPPQYQAGGDPVQQRIQLGMAINGAINLAASAVAAGHGRTEWHTIKEWRDALYYHVVLPAVGPDPSEGLMPEEPEGVIEVESPWVDGRPDDPPSNPPRNPATGWPIIVEEAAKGYNADATNEVKVTPRSLVRWARNNYGVAVVDMDIDQAARLAADIAEGHVAGYA